MHFASFSFFLALIYKMALTHNSLVLISSTDNEKLKNQTIEKL